MEKTHAIRMVLSVLEQIQKARQVGGFAVFCAVILRLYLAGLPAKLLQPENIPFRKYLETGQNVRSLPSNGKKYDFTSESAVPMLPEQPEIEILPAFSQQDAAQVYDTCGAEPDTGSLLTRQLDWQLDSGEPTVLILHTHATESYTKAGEDYIESSDYRTLDDGYNLVSIGDRVAARLEAEGIHVIHDRLLHDYPSYNSAYVHARKTLKKYLADNPGIQLVLDLHRDAVSTKAGQMCTEAIIDGQPGAQLMLVMGTGNAGRTNAYWEDNLAVALKLHVLLERENPGIMRPINLRSQRFNQDLLPGTLLVEIGAAGNTRQEALLAADALAEGIAALKHGSG